MWHAFRRFRPTSLARAVTVSSIVTLGLTPSLTQTQCLKAASITPFERAFESDPAAVSEIKWDVVIIGGGFGGGTLANLLSAPEVTEGSGGVSKDSKPKRILLVERGGLMFPTHVLNTAGTVVHFHAKGSTQINDTLYKYSKSSYRTVLKENADSVADLDEYIGGPCYGLGGRGNLWGLYIPRVDTETLSYFPDSVREALVTKYYRQAECLLKNRAYHPDTKDDPTKPLGGNPFHHVSANNKNRILAERVLAALETKLGELNSGGALHGWKMNFKTPITWSLLAAQFKSDTKQSEAVYQFPQGAYSPVDAVLQQTLAQSVDTADGLDPNTIRSGRRVGVLTTLLGSQAMHLKFEKPLIGPKIATSLQVRGSNGALHNIRGDCFVLCAGTVDSAALLLRSAHASQTGEKRVYGFTDHNIYGGLFEFLRVPWYSPDNAAVQQPASQYTSVSTGDNATSQALKVESLPSSVSIMMPANVAEARAKELLIPCMKLNVECTLEWTGDSKIHSPINPCIPFLLNICCNAASFLKHEDHAHAEPAGDFVNFTYEFRAARLDQDEVLRQAAFDLERGVKSRRRPNWVTIDDTTGEPAIFIRRSGDEVETQDEKDAEIRTDIKKVLQSINIKLSQVIADSVSGEVGFLIPHELTNIDKAAGIGCVAHEIGTIPMRKSSICAHSHDSAFSVDAKQCLDGTWNVFVNDLSVLPVSPPANPSLTLAALTMRLADELRKKPESRSE